MKKLATLILVAAASLLALTSCTTGTGSSDTDSDSGVLTITITNIPAEYNGLYAFVSVLDANQDTASTSGIVTAGSISGVLEDDNEVSWTGSSSTNYSIVLSVITQGATTVQYCVVGSITGGAGSKTLSCAGKIFTETALESQR